jgi:hypothetical protein
MSRFAIPLAVGLGALLLVTPFARKYFGDMDMTYGFVGIGAGLFAGGIAALFNRAPASKY